MQVVRSVADRNLYDERNHYSDEHSDRSTVAHVRDGSRRVVAKFHGAENASCGHH